MRRALVLALVVVSPLLGGAPCTIEAVPPEGQTDGGTADGGVPSRRVDFSALEPGEYEGSTIDGVTVAVEPWQGSRVVVGVNLFGDGTDLQLACGALRVTPPEAHAAMGVVFNDDGGTLLVSVFDAAGVSFMEEPIDTRRDAKAVGIARWDASHSLLSARAASATRPIGALVIASCGGTVRQVVFE